MNDAIVKREAIDPVETSEINRTTDVSKLNSIVDISTGTSGSESSGSGNSDFSVVSFMREIKGKGFRDVNGGQDGVSKKPKIEDYSVVVPLGFLDPLPPEERMTLSVPEITVSNSRSTVPGVAQSCKQFWKAGDYEGGNGGVSAPYAVGMDHVRVHPRFLHSNATSHKWALGAFAELLDNSLDEVCYGATYVRVDMLTNKKDGNKMLLVKDNGGGMNPDKMRQCMSLGYSQKSKLANTIGQYGNGFKTSTMRLGADVIVFSRCQGKDGMSPTQSIGMLSYTFLRSTGKEDIVVPIVDYENRGRGWNRIMRKSPDDWDKNLETLVQWSPFVSKEDLIKQFDFLKDQGTRMVIYNLWEDDQGQLELDFDTDTCDIQIRGVNRDEKKIEMARKYPNSRHFLTYRHSLRSYASILYLRLPPGFRIILRGKDVDHHNIINDMMMTEKITYKPIAVADGMPNDSNMVAVVTIGFVKDAEDHIDVQGFNVYHKNRLIKPFWRVWNAAGSDGRGVIGVLEANFVEPAHDKQGFERTTVLSRLEARLVGMQKQYWSTKCQEIGYAQRRHLKKPNSSDRESPPSDKDKSPWHSNQNGKSHRNEGSRKKSTTEPVNQSSPIMDQRKDEMTPDHHEALVSGSSSRKTYHASGGTQQGCSSSRSDPIASCSYFKGADSGEDRPIPANSNTVTLIKLHEENRQLKERLKGKSEPIVANLQNELQFEKDRRKSLEIQLHEAKRKIEELDKEQEALIDIFQEERNRRDEGELNMRKRLEDASNTMEELLGKLERLENMRIISGKLERCKHQQHNWSAF